MENIEKDQDQNSNCGKGKWTTNEEGLFCLGLEIYGNDHGKVSNFVSTRDIKQVRSHSQHHFKKLAKNRQKTQFKSPIGGTCPTSTEQSVTRKDQRKQFLSDSLTFPYPNVGLIGPLLPPGGVLTKERATVQQNFNQKLNHDIDGTNEECRSCDHDVSVGAAALMMDYKEAEEANDESKILGHPWKRTKLLQQPTDPASTVLHHLSGVRRDRQFVKGPSVEVLQDVVGDRFIMKLVHEMGWNIERHKGMTFISPPVSSTASCNNTPKNDNSASPNGSSSSSEAASEEEEAENTFIVPPSS